MVDPLLNGALHLDLGHPVDVVGRRLVVRRGCDELVQFGVRDRGELRNVVPVYARPLHEVVVEDVELLEPFARVVYESNLDVVIRRVDLAAAFVDGPEDRFDARRGLAHQRRGSRGGDRQHGDVAAARLDHPVVERRIGLANAGDHRILLFALGVIEREGSALLGHDDRCAVSGQCKGFVYLDGEIDRFVRTVAHAQCGDHVALGRDSQTRAAALDRHFMHLLPEVALHVADVRLFGIGVDLMNDLLDLFQLQIDDVVHHAHCLAHMGAELFEVERRLLREGFVDVAEKVQRQQAARVVGAERNFTAGIGRDGVEALVGIAVGHALADDRVPEQHARLGRFPCVVDDLFPQRGGVYVLLVHRFLGVDRELLMVGLAGDGGAHELVVDLNRDVGARHLRRIDFGVDEAFGVGMFDRDGQHQGSPTAVLRHLARRVGVAFHEGDDSRRREGRVQHGAARGAQMREVVSHAAAPFHDLHLLLVHADDAAVGVGRLLVADDEAVRQRRDLQVVADAGHRAALRNYIAEMVEQGEDRLARHGVGILLLDAFDLGGDAAVHIFGRTFVNMAERIFEGVFRDPYRRCQLVAGEVLLRPFDGVVIGHLFQPFRGGFL